MLGAMAITWSNFSGIVSALTDELSTTDLIAILAGLVGITIPFTLIYRFAARIRNTITGAMTNSKRKRG